ncbi:MAG: insulinase family protein [Oscillospiraceae bacterium]|jgi:predicted Zn-dependent peptidase|nr:insulinase family protein [Oscillospiraceae bacterium]
MELKEVRNNRAKESYFCGTHESGLRVCIFEKKNSHSSFAVLGTKFGSINTKFRDKKTAEIVRVPDGIAHYLEHKLFENEDKDSFQEFAKTGASANAYTSFELTAYLFSCTKNFFESLDILLNFVQSPYFTEENVKKERGIIAQEIRMYDDDPNWRVENNMLAAMYHNHPVRVDIAGDVESISRITPQSLFLCYNNFYNLKNMSLCIAGKEDKNEILKMVNKKIKTSSPINPESFFPDEPPGVLNHRVEQKFDIKISNFKLGFKEKITNDELDVEKIVLTDFVLEIFASKTSSLYRELMDKKLINDSFGFNFVEGPHYAHIVFGGESNDPDLVAQIIKNAMVEFKKDNSIGLGDFERIKKVVYAQYVLVLDEVKDIANLMLSTSLFDREFFSCIDIAANVKIEDVRNRLMEIDPDNSCLSIVSPLKSR